MRRLIDFFINTEGKAWRSLVVAFVLLRGVAIAALVVGVAWAQDASDFEREGRGERLAILDLPAAEDVAASGGQTVRAYVYGAFSGILPALVLDRPSRGPPRLEVIGGVSDGSHWRRAIWSAPMPEADWTHLFTEGQDTVGDWEQLEARRKKPPDEKVNPPPGLTELLVCADGQDSIVEVAEQGQVHRGAEHDCEFRELGDFAADLAAEAIKLWPDCATYTAEVMYGDLGRLRACLLTSGDRRAALAAITAAFGPDRRDFSKLADDHIVAAWPGRPKAVGGKAFAGMWSDLAKSISPIFQVGEAIGETDRRATLRGIIFYIGKDDDYRRADCVETWVKTPGGWRMTRLTVGAFAPHDMPHDPRQPT